MECLIWLYLPYKPITLDNTEARPTSSCRNESHGVTIRVCGPSCAQAVEVDSPDTSKTPVLDIPVCQLPRWNVRTTEIVSDWPV